VKIILQKSKDAPGEDRREKRNSDILLEKRDAEDRGTHNKGCSCSQTVQPIEEIDRVRDGNHPENRCRNGPNSKRDRSKRQADRFDLINRESDNEPGDDLK